MKIEKFVSNIIYSKYKTLEVELNEFGEVVELGMVSR